MAPEAACPGGNSENELGSRTRYAVRCVVPCIRRTATDRSWNGGATRLLCYLLTRVQRTALDRRIDKQQGEGEGDGRGLWIGIGPGTGKG